MKNWILTGFMGAGKSKTAQELAKLSHRECIDLDEWARAKNGQAIEEIFKTGGEAAFRQLEKELCREAAGMQNIVLASGGGTVQDPGCRELLKQNGIFIYLDVDFATVYDRIKNSPRPLVQRLSRQQLHELFLQRRPVYLASADLVITYKGENPPALAQKIWDRLNNISQEE